MDGQIDKIQAREGEQCAGHSCIINLRLLGLIGANGDNLMRSVLLLCLRLLLRIIDHLLLSG